MNKGWMLFDVNSGNAIDMTMDEELYKLWSFACNEDESLVVLPFDVPSNDGPVSTTEEGGASLMAKKEGEDSVTEFKPKAEEGPDEPADDTAEAQPSIEREGAAIGSTGGGSAGAGESGGLGSAGNS